MLENESIVNFVVTSGHGCFNAYLKRFKKRDDESCPYCRSLVENAEHTLFVCPRWGARREAVGRAVGAQLTPDTMVSLMLQSEQIWMLIESFVTLVMKTREFVRGVFLVLTGMPRPVLGESCTPSIKDFAIFPPHQKKTSL